MRLKARFQPQPGKTTKLPPAVISHALSKPRTNPISSRLLFAGGISFVLGMTAIVILPKLGNREPATPVIAPALTVPETAVPAISNPPPAVADNRDKTAETRQHVAATVNGWATAWAVKDADGYLSFYAPDFSPPRGMTRAGWEEQRRSRLRKYRKIEIALSGLTVSLAKDTAAAEFVQSFQADGFSEIGLRKRLDFELHGGHWMIVKETSGKHGG